MNESKNEALTALVISIQALGVAICSFLVYAFIGLWLEEKGLYFHWVLLISFGIGIITWAAVLLRTPLLSWWTINVKPPYRVLLCSQTKSERFEGKYGKIDTDAIREIPWGWHGKWPSEIPVASVDMQAGLLIGNSVDAQSYNPLKVYLKDGTELHIGWRTRLTPLPGHLRNYFLYTDIEQISYFRAIFIEVLIKWFSARKNGEKVFKELQSVGADGKTGKDSLAEEFKNTLGGKNVHKIEIERGMFSGESPEITGIVRSEETQKIKQSGMATKAISKNAAQLEKSFSDKTRERLNPNLALITAAQAAGVKIDAEVFVGLEGLDVRAVGAMLARKQQTGKGGKTT